MYTSFIKPLFDKIFALLGLILLSPLFLILICVLFLEHRANPFFTQKRAGFKGKVFIIYKFKTLNENADKNGNLLTLNERVTTLGKFLRKTSIDELPQLFNILRGDMSIVGPRPLLVEYLKIYNSNQKKRHTVMPGLTGWAQINGRNHISWIKKFEYDLWYVKNQSFLLDIRIIFLTAQYLLFTKKVHDSTCINVPTFQQTEVE